MLSRISAAGKIFDSSAIATHILSFSPTVFPKISRRITFFGLSEQNFRLFLEQNPEHWFDILVPAHPGIQAVNE